MRTIERSSAFKRDYKRAKATPRHSKDLDSLMAAILTLLLSDRTLRDNHRDHALSGDWAYVEDDIRAVCDEAHRHGAKVKVIFENDLLANGGAGLSGDGIKIKLCHLSEAAGADWVKTSSGYGFVKQPDGSYNYKGATEHDLRLMRANVSAKVQVKAAGGVRDLDGLIRVRELGASRCGATATAAMLDEFRRREKAPSAAPSAAGKIGGGGY